MKAIVEFPKGKEKEFQRMMKELGAYVGACSEEMFISRACSIENVRQQIDDFCEDCRKDGRSAPVDQYFDKEALANKIYRECVHAEKADTRSPAYDTAQDILIDYQERAEMLRTIKRKHPRLDMKEASSLAFALPSEQLFRMKDREFLEAVDQSTRKLRRVRTIDSSNREARLRKEEQRKQKELSR